MSSAVPAETVKDTKRPTSWPPPPLPAAASQFTLPLAPAALTLVFGTSSMQEYVYNWLAHAARVPALRPYAAIAVDDELLHLCLEWREPVLSASDLLSADVEALNATLKLRARCVNPSIELATLPLCFLLSRC